MFAAKFLFLLSAVAVAGYTQWNLMGPNPMPRWVMYCSMAYIAMAGGLAINMILAKV